METRQAGVTLMQNLNLLKGIKSKNEADMYRSIMIDAYKQPKFSGKEYQRNAINEFQNKTMLACLEEIKKH